uniref:Uncharacterized protein n=1 Tax=Utricularia reniformis TaxID=192314 RepID=A0A1Y0AZL7_9LAMI|nr:hypothetical protein AEK19_MT0335 [Utricularia reniformis]ART30607.1 hypothetical protein AEK19_MT0335 [Utricularia reniformis]
MVSDFSSSRCFGACSWGCVGPGQTPYFLFFPLAYFDLPSKERILARI